MECETYTRVSTITRDGVLESTTTQEPYEVCGRLEIEQEEFTNRTTTTNSLGTTVFTIRTTCN
ncbi:hypothetical protein CLV84_3865 [Neolewinella xylanilytica]|uniref:Uncharacterized protein n=1 Tax=Neolewinella xylanilytica TaxID=1514080 RepID=A0A2S6I1F7_9BACT|nr:hypothetical protein [Neolewinella xylanilytica]PPK84703.1 hypothetical protein CLV84_3865 [Neolewinella xylanilytica]